MKQKTSLFNVDDFVKNPFSVIPVKTGIHKYKKRLDSRMRGNDYKLAFSTFYESINVGRWVFDVGRSSFNALFDFYGFAITERVK